MADILTKALTTLSAFFEVRGPASLKREATPTTVRVYFKGLRPRLIVWYKRRFDMWYKRRFDELRCGRTHRILAVGRILGWADRYS